tara:strand:+ start:199389 stop:199799 length:411 start_codon:yes stop_codon:yes gene_type:complete
MSHKIKLFRKFIILISFSLIISNCSLIDTSYAPIEGQTSFSSPPIVKDKTYHSVKSGETLWNISDKYYNNPFLWPIIYKHNHDTIYDADLIFPGQNLIIEANINNLLFDKAIMHAKNRGVWIIGYQEESDRRFLLE